MSKHVTMCDMRDGNTYSGRFFFGGGAVARTKKGVENIHARV